MFSSRNPCLARLGAVVALLLLTALALGGPTRSALAGHSPPAWISFGDPVATSSTLAKMNINWEKQPDYKGSPRLYNLDWSSDSGRRWYDGYQGYRASWTQYGLLIGATYKYRVNSKIAGHWSGYTYGSKVISASGTWDDDHTGVMVDRPHGLYGITSTFGYPCKTASLRSQYFTNGFTLRVHQKLQKNLKHVGEHLTVSNKGGAVRQAGSYNCRKMAGSSKWSTHAWGIAIDINWADNPHGQTYWRGDPFIPQGFENHRWYWGLDFRRIKDPMHFQYATGY